MTPATIAAKSEIGDPKLVVKLGAVRTALRSGEFARMPNIQQSANNFLIIFYEMMQYFSSF